MNRLPRSSLILYMNLHISVAIAIVACASSTHASDRFCLIPAGVTPTLLFVGDVSSGVAGFESDMTEYSDASTAYRQLMSVGIEFDTDASGLWSGGTGYIGAEWFKSWGVGDGEGLIHGVSDIDADAFYGFGEAWYEQRLFGDRLWARAGRMYSDSDFAAVETAGGFMNAALPAFPNVIQPAYPEPALGAMAWAEPLSWLTIGGGVFDAAEYESIIGTSASAGTNMIVETQLTWESSTGSVQTTYQAGMWVHSGSLSGLRYSPPEHFCTADLPVSITGNGGWYTTAELSIPSPISERLSVFAMLSGGDSETLSIDRFYGAGLVLDEVAISPLPTQFGVAISHADVSEKLNPVFDYERVFEAYLSFEVMPWFGVSLDAQHIQHPSGITRDGYADAGTTVGMRVVVEY
jgi:carbohydrate-selective porin OprB